MGVREQVVKPATAIAGFFLPLRLRRDQMDNMASSARLSTAKLPNHLTTVWTDKVEFSVGAAADRPHAINHYAGNFRAARSWARRVIRFIAAPAFFLLLHQPSAEAGSATATLTVRARVVRGCRLSTSAGVTTELGGSASLHINCATGSGETIAIGAGSNAHGSTALRSLSVGNGTLSYPIHDVSISTDQDTVILTVNF